MEYFRSTGTSSGLIFTRTSSAYIKERCGELLRLVSEADRAVIDGASDAAMRLSLVRDLVLATVGPAWVRDHEDDQPLLALRNAQLPAFSARETASAFDRLCSDVLRARFPAETERPPADRNTHWG